MRKLLLNKQGFTLVEILTAAGVLSVFLIGLFSFYRMGSMMFMTGSWKLQKQKQTERFLTVLKERIEQASNATSLINGPSVVPGPGPATLNTSIANLVCPNDGSSIANITGNTRIMIFSVCKPDMTLIGQGAGLILYHCLMAVPAAKNLYTLYLHADTAAVAYNGIDYFNTTAAFKPTGGGLPGFAETPSTFGLNAPFTMKLDDVLNTSIFVNVASGTNTAVNNTEKIVQVALTLRRPGHANEPNPTINHQVRARVDYSVPVVTYAVGGF